MTLRKQHAENLALHDRLADFGAGRIEEALNELMSTLATHLAASDILWVGAVRVVIGQKARCDVLRGWRVRVFEHLHSRADVERRSDEAMQEQDLDPAMTTRAMAEKAGRFRVHRLRDGFIDYAAFKRTNHYRKFYLEPGLEDRMWAAIPVSSQAESVFVADLYQAGCRFTDQQANEFGEMLRGLKWFHRQLFLSRGLHLLDKPLPPSQRRVLNGLLSDRTEKQIAAELGLTTGTTHQYAVEIYRRFGVKGRAGLMALWLGG